MHYTKKIKDKIRDEAATRIVEIMTPLGIGNREHYIFILGREK